MKKEVEVKILKFKDHLVPLVLSGEKYTTWRLFDDKNLQPGDELVFVNKDSNVEFAKATILATREKRLGDVLDTDFEGHERFEDLEKMYESYRQYYGDVVSPDSVLKMITFKIHD